MWGSGFCGGTYLGGSNWFRTGDNVRQDSDGYLFYIGRTDDIITSSGYRIGPQEVENVLLEQPLVQESAVVVLSDSERGEIVAAFVVLTEPFLASDQLADDLQAHVKQSSRAQHRVVIIKGRVQ